VDSFYRFKLGDFSCTCVSDGEMNYPVPPFARDVPVSWVETVLRAHDLPTTHIYSPYTCLFVDTGEHKVLVDTGVGERIAASIKDLFPNVDNSKTVCGTLAQNLKAAGIERAEVDTVIITHAHLDHIGGALDIDGSLMFPKAHYYIWQEEWAFWSSDERTAKMPPRFVETARSNIEPLLDRLTLVERESEIVPGIFVVATPGHTPGHIALSITSEDEQLLHLSDVVIHPIQLEHPDWLVAFDVLPEQTLASRRLICDRAASSGALVFAHHFPPFPNLGRIVEQGEVWHWKPVGATV
jgi:glyoxylase-like metal-dependent hydrolase (beta-lactamase superfamily II)